MSGNADKGSKIWTYPGSGSATSTTLGSATVLDDPWGVATLGGHGGIDAFSSNPKEGLVSKGFTGGDTDGLSNSQHQPFNENSATFIVDYSGSISSITDVKFLFGTTAGTGDETGDAVLVPVPEPTTLIAGVLLLLPFGASALRMIRRKQAA